MTDGGQNRLVVTHAIEKGGTLPYAKLALRNGSGQTISQVTVKHHKVNKRGETHAVYQEVTGEIPAGQLRQIFSQHFYEDTLHIDDIIVKMSDGAIVRVRPSRSEFSSGCFIATKLIPDDARTLSALRWLRDDVLLPRPGGRSFVFWYYHRGYEIATRLNASGPVARILKLFLKICGRLIERSGGMDIGK